MRLVVPRGRRRAFLRHRRLTNFSIRPDGPFSLREAAGFGFGPSAGEGGELMRLAFALDGFAGHAGVLLSQDAHGVVHGEAEGAGPLDVVERQVRRILSLDHSGSEFLEVGRRDPVIGRLQERLPGLRPVLFNSPYEAAAWSVLSQRRRRAQAMSLRQSLSAEHGATFELAGESVDAFPLPETLLELEAFPSIEPQRLERLHAVARAALTGMLDPRRLQSIGWERALEEVQLIPGIGPMYAGLIVHRSCGFADSLASGEQRGLDYIARLYGRDAELEQVAERWRPFRTWCAVLVRVAGDRGAI